MAKKLQEFWSITDYVPRLKTANCDAVKRDMILANTTGGTFTVTLPATPSIGDIVTVLDSHNQWSTNNLTVSPNGGKIDSSASNYTCNGSAKGVVFKYSGNATVGWVALPQGIDTTVDIYDYTVLSKTADYTAVSMDMIFANTDSSSFTITLPATPSTGQRVVVVDSAYKWATNNLTIDRNGSNINNAAANFTCTGTAKQVIFTYSGVSAVGWIPVESNIAEDTTYFNPQVKNSAYTAVSQDLVLADTSAGSFSITLPATPSAGDLVTIQDSKATWSVNNLTVARNGSNIDGAAANYTADGSIPVLTFIYSGDATEGWTSSPQAGTTGGGANEIVLYPNNFKLDDTDTGVDNGTAFSMLDSIDFDPATQGAVWSSFRLPGGFDETQDINVELNYSLNGSDDGKTVKLTIDYWAVSEGDTPNIASPTETNTDDITSATTNTGKYYSGAANVISAASISSTTETVILKITRDADNVADNYSGTLQLFSVKFSQ